jgi:hypothetical protein
VACKGIDMYDGNAWLTTQRPRTGLGRPESRYK